ncbi:MAG: hypothetical protein K2Q12_04485 [Rickettsiales bacterium]|nr:hypothetical protein [Rickettsiales bacterium]
MTRTILAFLFAPLVPALPFFLFGLIVLVSDLSLKSLGTFFGMFLFIGLIAYPPMMVMGIPAYFFLRFYMKTASISVYALSGSIMGALYMFFIMTFNNGSISNFHELAEAQAMYGVFVFASFGMLSALVFRAIAKPHLSKTVTTPHLTLDPNHL